MSKKKPYAAVCKVTFEMELDDVMADNDDKAMTEVQSCLLDWYKLYQADHVKYEIDIIEYDNVDYSDPKT